MRILILSNMYPSRQKPYAGIFVRNQVEILRDQYGDDLELTVRAMRRRYTGRIGTAIKYFLFTFSCLPNFFMRYDVVHVHYFVPLGVLGAIYCTIHSNSRLVVTFHGGDVNPHHFRGWLGNLWRAASKKVDLGIAVGPAVADLVDTQMDVKSCTISPAGVDSRKFYPPDQGPQKKEYDFLFAGSFVARKGVDLFVEALADDRFAGMRVGFVGTGPLRSRIVSLENSRDIEIFDHLSQDELRKVFWKSQYLVLPSRSEPFGLVVSEAMYCGVPAIVSDEPGPASQVRHEDNGYVFPNGSIVALTDTLLIAANLKGVEYAEMAAKARGSNRQFDIYEVTNELVKRYYSFATKPGSANR